MSGPYCLNCRRHRTRAKRTRAGNRDNNLRRNYGLSAAEVAGMCEAQGGCCPICQQELTSNVGTGGPAGTDGVVDHCHDTGRVRGVLCAQCNRGIGSLGDDPERLARAIEYLLHPPTTLVHTVPPKRRKRSKYKRVSDEEFERRKREVDERRAKRKW